jgi:hypothetical protein
MKAPHDVRVAVLFDLSWVTFGIAELYVYSTQLGALILNLNVLFTLRNVRDQEM